jgi:hypothetical protein
MESLPVLSSRTITTTSATWLKPDQLYETERPAQVALRLEPRVKLNVAIGCGLPPVVAASAEATGTAPDTKQAKSSARRTRLEQRFRPFHPPRYLLNMRPRWGRIRRDRVGHTGFLSQTTTLIVE